MLAIGAIAGTMFLGLGWRALRAASRVEGSVHFALALVITVWLALPAIAALRHGFVLSFG